VASMGAGFVVGRKRQGKDKSPGMRILGLGGEKNIQKKNLISIANNLQASHRATFRGWMPGRGPGTYLGKEEP